MPTKTLTIFYLGDNAAHHPFTAPADIPLIKYLPKKQYTTSIGTMAMVAPANIIFQAAVPSPAFLSIFTPTVKGLIDSLVMVNTNGRIYSFHPCLKDRSAMVAITGLRSGRITIR